LTDDPDDPSRRLIRHVLGAVNDYERGMIRLRLRRGQQRKAELGGYAAGRPRYGYRAEGKQLVEVPGEQEVIKRVRRLRRIGCSYRQISAELEGERLRPRSGGRWHPTMLARIAP
jgi:DNA invertase Pin-like site-specific DNA recombinase